MTVIRARYNILQRKLSREQGNSFQMQQMNVFIQGGKCLTPQASALKFYLGGAQQCPKEGHFKQEQGAFSCREGLKNYFGAPHKKVLPLAKTSDPPLIG